MALNNNDEAKTNKLVENERLVVRVDQNSDSDLQALFDSVLKPDSKRPLQVPLRMRKLPNSFFNPPSTGSRSPSVSHSRENSSDSAFVSGVVSPTLNPGGASNTPAPATQVNNVVSSNSGNDPSGIAQASPLATLTISHARARSSPASLQQTYAVNNVSSQNAGPTPQHFKQRSYNIVQGNVDESLGPLPPGWERARTSEGQVYYLNHLTKTTTWEDPRLSLAAMGSQHPSAEQLLTRNITSQVTQPTTTSKLPTDPLGPLPEGVEQAQTAEGEVYFINHLTRTTSWFDPRIPAELQRNPALNAMLPQLFLNTNVPHSAQEQQTNARLQSLKIERDMLKQRQQEINLRDRQQKLIHHPATSELTLDPFFSSLSEHARQESADSGLGLGTSYSLPQTPEDFLETMDDKMDCVSESGTSLDASLVNEEIGSTDDLVPSLQLGEDFSNDILEDVQTFINPSMGKTDNVLTWL